MMTVIGTPSAQRMIDFMTRISTCSPHNGRPPRWFPPRPSSGRRQRPVEIVVNRRLELPHVRGEEMIGTGDRFVLDLHALLVSELLGKPFRGLCRHDVIPLAMQDQS